MANYVYIATSLDGYIAAKDGGIDWLMDIPSPDDSDYGFNDFMQRIDAIIMGRNSFEKVLTFDSWIYPKIVFVMSNTMKDVPPEVKGKAEVIGGDPNSVLQNLNKKGYHNFYVDGGKLIQSFLREDLIDEMIITRIPILLGDGIPLFGNLPKPMKFSEVKTEILDDLLVKSYYKR